MRHAGRRDPSDRDQSIRGAHIRASTIRASTLKTLQSAAPLIVAAEALCVTWLVIANVVARPTSSDMGRLLLLMIIAGLYAEGGSRIERLRRYVAETTFSNGSSLWCFAAALILPVGLAGAFAAALYGHDLWTGLRERSIRPLKLVYTGSTEILATMSAAAVLANFHTAQGHLARGLLGAVAVTIALVVYAVVNQSLVTSVIYLATKPARLRDVMISRDDEWLEIATLALAVLFAVALVNAPFLSPFTLLLIMVLRRSALVRELQVQATRDAKTGLLNAGGWRQEAERELLRAGRAGNVMTVLMIDLDHFKRLNDRYGHPAGDAALKAVGSCITEALRGYDALGRYGGEEFIALLTEADESVSEAVATRLCARIRAIELEHGDCVTASIGVGMGVAGVHGLDELISVADKALYVAKGAGRDRVHVARAASMAQIAPTPPSSVPPAPRT